MRTKLRAVCVWVALWMGAVVLPACDEDDSFAAISVPQLAVEPAQVVFVPPATGGSFVDATVQVKNLGRGHRIFEKLKILFFVL